MRPCGRSTAVAEEGSCRHDGCDEDATTPLSDLQPDELLMVRAAIAVVVLGLVGAVACVADRADDAGASSAQRRADVLRWANERGNEQQTAALADGVIDRAEMEASIRNFEDCLASTHWRLEDVHPDPFRGEPHYSFLVTSDRPGRDQAPADECEQRTFRWVSIYAQTIQRPSPIEPSVLARLRRCLVDRGVRTDDGDITARAVFATGGRGSQREIVECMQSAFAAVYPDRPFPGVSPTG